MPVKLSTTVTKISLIRNPTNQLLVREFYDFMKSNGCSEKHINNNLKAVMNFDGTLDSKTCFLEIQTRDQILSFLDSKIKSAEVDPDGRWITTWNHYLSHLKYFFRWFYNIYKNKKSSENETSYALSSYDDWETPAFIQIKKKKTKRPSPYLETELWDRDELLCILKYEPSKRNKAALALFWDLNARNHEVTLLKIKHIRLKERYGEGEIPHEAKTGTGPILLTCSFPYLRDWLNEHPFRNEPNARLICSRYTGGPIKPEAMWSMMKYLRSRIISLIKEGSITNKEEKEKLEYLLRTKKWNPYCIRHSSITSDSDFLPEYALKKKVRWSMNSKQGARYIKRRMGNDLKQKILVQNGIISEQQIEKKPSILNCPRCSLVNAIDNKYCSKCSYPLVPSAFDEIKEAENIKFQAMEERFSTMQSQIQSLISVFSNMKDQTQVDGMAKMLYGSGLIINKEKEEKVN
jgi:integrase/recombinase XerD